MSALQSAHQHRQTNWFFDFREESSVVTPERKKRRQAKRTVYEKECKGCGVTFKCEIKRQPYCSHQCYAKHRAKIPSMIPCMVCLQGLGYGIKAIGRIVAMKHISVRTAMVRAGVYNPKGTMRAAGNRELHSCRTNAIDAGHTPKITRGAKRTGESDCKTPIQKTRRMLRAQISRMCLHMRVSREMRTEQYVGCSFDEAKRRIESQFTRGMTWENCGSFWHLDHIVPLSAFNLSDSKQLMLANHISNLRPLNAKENLRKGNKVPIAHQFDLVAN